MRRAARRDATEPEIIRALEKAGALVLRLNEFDLLVYHRRKLFMLDAKTAKGRATLSQERLIEQGWPLQFVRDADEALRAIYAIP